MKTSKLRKKLIRNAKYYPSLVINPGIIMKNITKNLDKIKIRGTFDQLVKLYSLFIWLNYSVKCYD